MDFIEQTKREELNKLRSKLADIFTIIVDENPDFKELTDVPVFRLLERKKVFDDLYNLYNGLMVNIPYVETPIYEKYKEKLENVAKYKELIDEKIDEVRKKNLKEVQTIESMIDYLSNL